MSQRDDTKSRIDVGTLLETDIAQPLADAQQAIGRAFRRVRRQRGAEAAKGPALARAAAEL